MLHTAQRGRLAIISAVCLMIAQTGGVRAGARDDYTKAEFSRAIDTWRTNTVIGHGAAYDAVNRMIAHGDKALPWLVGRLHDFRPCGSFAIPNRSPDAFEEYFDAGPFKSVSDAARCMLQYLMPHRDLMGLGSKPVERRRAIRDWETWYVRYRDRLKWLPDKQYFVLKPARRLGRGP